MPPTTHRRKTTQRKITQKELKQPDEFTTLAESVQNFILGNLNQVFISLGIVAAIGAVVIAVYYYEQHRDAVASTQFYTALTQLKGGQYKAAEAQFKKLADEEPGRRLGRLARFYTASAYLGDGDLPRARDTLVAFLAEERDPLFTGLALTNLAVVYERMGDWKKAGGAYRQAAGIDGPEQMRSQLGVARMLAKMGDKQDAITAYRGFLMAHPYAQQREDVLASLALLGAPAVPPPPAIATTK
ncbi:MAG: tetratricopeptide repeat protein [Candidatus Binatus sp.]|uniref:tetratricopeptide repeat protein n=1 Tax=Candidatus Binatus sp. TaxID=2811406 RepID=UPI00271709A7|nr:tetratricopeptide repeat protein [Candidatus Binatus sp.]MDO8433194.1 tetratricopeptide repeat protein [Candidatus Binatus sp.]